MNKIAICYSEKAIKITDSYCSSPSNNSFSTPNLTPSIQDSVTCTYKVKLSSNKKQFQIKFTWCNKLHKGFSIAISDYPFSCSKFNKSSQILYKDRGTKAFDSCSSEIEVIWDICRAQYDSGPEPINGFYILVLVNSEIVLFLGDMEVQELDKVKRPEFSLISRCERYSGNALYSTRAKFCDTGTCHDILINFIGTMKNPILSVYIDKRSVIQVKRLQWNFRGNQTMFLDGLLVDMMWDVHDWLFSTGYAVFMFRTRSGFDSRLWLEEKNLEQNEHERTGFSLLVCACKDPD
ncbi:hypothetical protein ACJIZ3_024363 [Penstemon smallii]|uniref:CUB domain-containing protein n=1 Tax=Penstemon smallii TaxID=265156 RepID=A0ABD3TSI9_9LAMI